MKFKVGDRVAAYFNGSRHTGRIITLVKDGECLDVMYDFGGMISRVHHKQCRRLVKKKKNDEDEKEFRRWVFNVIPDVMTDLEGRIVKLESQHKDKTPHKCPVCEGYGSQRITEDTAQGPAVHFRAHYPCHGCNALGTVWKE